MRHFEYLGDYARTALIRGGGVIANAFNLLALVGIGAITVVAIAFQPDPAAVAIIAIAAVVVLLLTHYGAFIAYQSERRERESALEAIGQAQRERDAVERERDQANRERERAERERDALQSAANRTDRVGVALKELNQLASEGAVIAEAEESGPIVWVAGEETPHEREEWDKRRQWLKRQDEYHARVRDAISEVAPEYIGQWDAAPINDRHQCLLDVIRELRGRL